MEKYQAIDLRTGEKLNPAETFTLLPEKDPVALEALRTYRNLTSDSELRQKLTDWMNRIEQGPVDFTPAEERELVRKGLL